MSEHQISTETEKTVNMHFNLSEAYGWELLSSKTCVSEWHKKFSQGREYVKAIKWLGCPVMIKTEENENCGASCEKMSSLMRQSDSKGV
jgi:hypothetical protein